MFSEEVKDLRYGKKEEEKKKKAASFMNEVVFGAQLCHMS